MILDNPNEYNLYHNAYTLWTGNTSGTDCVSKLYAILLTYPCTTHLPFICEYSK